MRRETIEREFVAAAPACLMVANICGSVDIQPGDDGIVTITAVKHLDTGDPDRTEIEIGQEEDGSVIVKTVFEEGGRLFVRRRPCNVDYIVRVPRACALKITCVSSRAAVRDLEGEFYLKTVSGRMLLRDLSGRIKVTSVSGDVFGERISGPMVFETVSGKVSLTESYLPFVTGLSVSGDLVLQTPLGAGPYGFKTVSGDVGLVLPPGGPGCTIRFNSTSGRLKTSLPITHGQRRRHRWHAELQGGGPEVRFKSTSGNLSVMQSSC